MPTGDDATLRFSFPCPRCQSLLESPAATAGEVGRCPTCDGQFIVPALDPQTGLPHPAARLDRDQQDATPLHAYAASGAQAPRIGHRADGTPCIECPRCGAHSDISANTCPTCGIPFTIDGVGQVTGPPGGGLAVAALVLGIAALPLHSLYVFRPLGILCGLASWFQARVTRPPTLALIGMLIAAVGTALSLIA